MAQLRSPKIAKASGEFHWSAWFPYPISWFRALILIPIAFPGARLIVFGFAGIVISFTEKISLPLLFCIVVGLVLPTIFLSFVYHFLWFIWKPQLSPYKIKWLPDLSSIWEAFYATVVTGISFLSILAIFSGTHFLVCNFETTEELGSCVGRATARAAAAIFGATDKLWDSKGYGVIIRQKDIFVVKPWFTIWLIVAAYLYQLEYVTRQRFIPWAKRATRKSILSRKYSRRKL